MSSEKQNKSENKSEVNTIQIKQSSLYTLVGSLVVIIALLVVVIITMINSPNSVNNGKVQKLSNKQQTEAFEILNKAMENFRSTSNIFSVWDGNTSTTMLYNSHGESIAEDVETGYKIFHLKDNKTINFSDTIGYTTDSEVISIAEQVLKLREEKGLKIYKLKSETIADTGDTSAEAGDVNIDHYVIDINGWDNIQDLYRYVSNDFSEQMINALKESVKQLSEAENSNISADEQLNLRFIFDIKDKEKLFGADCYIYFGDKKPEDITAADLNANWSFTDCIEIYDWEMDPKWYELDWENMDKWTDTTEVEGLLVSQYNTVLEVLDKFSADNNIAPVEDETDPDTQIDLDSLQEPTTDNTEGTENTENVEGAKESDNTENTENINGTEATENTGTTGIVANTDGIITE